ncbi:glycoside hydrolase family 108 protein [Variovorax sp. GT1P44]|uniref:glycoside hydrolase family 108 protein n=1 Tax=Variovorax sp. GT1P44 TaxID=3443742 RepID=UPI003F44F342
MNFDQAFDRLLGHEGGYSFSPSDPGGETMWGVTAVVARANGYAGAMKQLPRDTAKAIYQRKYWDAIQADKLPEALRFDVFDAAVNSGVSQAVKWLQRIAGVGDDGVIGPMTLNAASKLDGNAAAAAYSGVRLDFMTSLPTWGAYGRGWARRIASNLQAKV